ncbi:hypothetical protein CYLTODRAFT_485710 [Cylindrobasidium torrendii FP15055 ss-10]|uniref:P-loop containing nucleoside triphosphate hydrolase protein n=1 Tax=Cylindrobasidium torrendii FP15055 ss-10 TaxID=1314674 RepID=A0A0D7BSY5_9AGAR|nr:hypothetical protein CYLTODRAFT_485710 [Cylindrobasidium torrendii FP15055 ss-10]
MATTAEDIELISSDDPLAAGELHPAPRRGRARKSSVRPWTTPKKRKTPPATEDGRKEKKQRVETYKTAMAASVKALRNFKESAMRKWMGENISVFSAVLPAKSTFVDSITQESQGRPVAFSELTQQPSLIQGGEMKDYQLHGLSFLANMYRNGMNCILGDEMGLGKTLQTLSLFAYIREHATVPCSAPHLIICPLSVLSSWEMECSRWLPSLRVVRFHGPAAQRAIIKTTILTTPQERPDIVLTTYESFSAEDSWFKAHHWAYCVVDEGHKIKNAGTQLAGRLQGLNSVYRLILTGTPVQNDLTEVWGLLHFLYPTVFTERTEALFKDAFDVSRGKYETLFMDNVRKLLGIIMLRRTKDVVTLEVPPRQETTVFVPMSEAQRTWTYAILGEMDRIAMNAVFTGGDASAEAGQRNALKTIQGETQPLKADQGYLWKRLNNLLLKLLRVCDHPYLLPGVQPEPYFLSETIVKESCKLQFIDKILSDVLPKGERVLIFSKWTDMLNLIEDFMNLRGVKYARLDGSTLRPRRTVDIRLFQREDSPYQVYLISTKAGGLGINLTKASTVIMADSDWNPQNDLQAIARAHRIGQTKVVQVYRLICRGSVEDQMLDRLRRKLFLSLKVMANSGAAPAAGDNESTLNLNDLCSILRRGSSALENSPFDMDLATFTAAPVAEIVRVSREREQGRDAKLAAEQEGKDKAGNDALLSAEEEERQLLSGVAHVKCRLFEGRLIAKPISEKGKDKSIGDTKGPREVNAGEEENTSKRMRKLPDAPISPGKVQASAEARARAVKEAKTKTGYKFDHEDFCMMQCNDDGEAIMCNACPRVFHPKCNGITEQQARKPMILCPQHRCFECQKSSVEAGGMLFRCQTCPKAWCEECLPTVGTNDDIKIVGDVLPEFAILGFKASPSIFYIRCEECVTAEREEPAWWKEMWEAHLEGAERKYKKLLEGSR